MTDTTTTEYPTLRGTDPFLPGDNCWRTARTRRVKLLRNPDAYYHELARAILRARRQVLILAWDFDHRVQLTRNRADDGLPPLTFAELILRRLDQVPELEVHILVWDLSAIYTKAQDAPDLLRSLRLDHPRLTIHLDHAHPPLSSHHQKVVVIDDRIAFSGGMDITRARWDTAEHAVDDPRRRDPNHDGYRPYHDVHALIDGETAIALGELARERWRRATGNQLPAPDSSAGHDPWPEGLVADITDVRLAISRTVPPDDDQPAVREVVRLFEDMIGWAKSTIFFEQQYLTHDGIVDMLADRLHEIDGPEILIILPRDTSGILARLTMETLLPERLHRLRAADRHGRLRVVYPDAPGIPNEKGRSINVHAKLLIVDDRLIRVGSANMNGRSMRSDTELDLTISADEDPAVIRAIRRFRHLVLGEHLGLPSDAIAEAEAGAGSVIKAVDSMRNKDGKTLVEMHPMLPRLVVRALAWWPVPESGRGDVSPRLPSSVRPEHLIGFGSNRGADPFGEGKPRVWPVVLGVLVLLLLAAAWRWGPLGDIEVVAIARDLRGAPWTGPLIVTLYVVGCQVMVPVHLLHAVAGLAMGPREGMLYAGFGTMASAVVSYGIGWAVGRDVLRRRLGQRITRLSERAGDAGLRGALLLRLLPGAPFGLANMVFGASHVSFPIFLVATAVVMLPSLIVLAFLGDRLAMVWQNPSRQNLLALAAAVALALVIAAVGHRVVAWWCEREGA